MIKNSAKGAKHVKKRCSAKYPAMEEKLVKEYQEMHKKESKWRVSGLGWGVNNYWMHFPQEKTSNSVQVGSFKKQRKIALRCHTNVCQQPSSNKIQALRRFHRDINQKATNGSKDKMMNQTGKFSLYQMANVDQTLLPFTFTDGQTYSDKGEKSMWMWENQSGMNQRQCTVQITVVYLEWSQR